MQRKTSIQATGTSPSSPLFLRPRAVRPPDAARHIGGPAGVIEQAWRNGTLKYCQVGLIAFDPTVLRIGNCGIRVDISVLPPREPRLLRCTIPGCGTSYEIPDAAPAVPKTSIQQFLDSIVPLHLEQVTESSPGARYICSQHRRAGAHCVAFDFLGRTEREFYSVENGRIRSSSVDRDIHLQEHLNACKSRQARSGSGRADETRIRFHIFR
jgi:hypothetical protein